MDHGSRDPGGRTASFGLAGRPSVARPFALVLSGGGARGYSHAGVLRVLLRWGYRPSAIVGVSMGAVVGTAYAASSDWFDLLLRQGTDSFPHPRGHRGRDESPPSPLRRAWRTAVLADDLLRSWGPGVRAMDEGRRFLGALVGDLTFEDLAIPVAVCTTDLESGERVVIRTGPVDDAVYASAALAGVLPPIEIDGRLLADGAYSDIAPVDVARSFPVDRVIAVDPGQLQRGAPIRNGIQAVVRAMEICHRRHGDLRFNEADLVVRPQFRRFIDTLDFDAARECVAAGARATRAMRGSLARLLGPPPADS